MKLHRLRRRSQMGGTCFRVNVILVAMLKRMPGRTHAPMHWVFSEELLKGAVCGSSSEEHVGRVLGEEIGVSRYTTTSGNE